MRRPSLLRRRRSRGVFVAVVIVVALIAVIGGALLAYLIFIDEPRARTVVAAPPAPPKPVEAFVAEPLEPWTTASKPEREPRPRPRGTRPRARPTELDDAAIGSGLGRLQGSFDQCAREHGAVEGSLVRVGFSVSPDGLVEGAFALAPHGRTPLGRCIVDAVTRARMQRTEYGRQDIRWSLHLHP